MPHLVMEYSNSVQQRLNVQGLLEDLHIATIESQLFDSKTVKSRAVQVDHWLIGTQQDQADFIHVTLELLAGRSGEQKQALSQSLAAVLQQQANWITSLTVNIRDMDADSFQLIMN